VRSPGPARRRLRARRRHHRARRRRPGLRGSADSDPGGRGRDARDRSRSSKRVSVKRTIIFSDVHLSQAHPETDGDGLWMRYRRREFFLDREFATLVDHLLERFDGDAIELVFNGDLFDFDAPWVKDNKSSFDEFPLTDEGCAEHVKRIAADHGVWFDAV